MNLKPIKASELKAGDEFSFTKIPPAPLVNTVIQINPLLYVREGSLCAHYFYPDGTVYVEADEGESRESTVGRYVAKQLADETLPTPKAEPAADPDVVELGGLETLQWFEQTVFPKELGQCLYVGKETNSKRMFWSVGQGRLSYLSKATKVRRIPNPIEQRDKLVEMLKAFVDREVELHTADDWVLVEQARQLLKESAAGIEKEVKL